jgi:hypothetical protein
MKGLANEADRAKGASVVLAYSRKRCRKVFHRLLRDTSKTEMVLKPGAQSACWVTKLKPTKPGGYTQIHVKANKAKPLWHHLALRAAGRLESWEVLWRGNQKLDVSHRCNDPRCGNPDHLVVESKKTNNQRKGCPGPAVRVQVACPGDPANCECSSEQYVDLCRHEPRCIGGWGPAMCTPPRGCRCGQ